MLLGSSGPPLLNGMMWSTSHWAQPLGCVFLNCSSALASRWIRLWLSRGQFSHLMWLPLGLETERWAELEEAEEWWLPLLPELLELRLVE